MKRTTILNRELSYLIASLGHSDEIIVADASFAIPDGVAVIDLALMPGVPSIFDVIHAVASELMVEKIITCEEKPEAFEKLFETERSHWEAEQAKEIVSETLKHDAFMMRSENTKAIIRSGTMKPYSSVLLVSGLPI